MHTAVLFITNLADRTERLRACRKAPFYCVCQGQSGKRYVRNSHVSCPHSSIGAAVPLPGETQKANFAFISLQMQPGYFYSCIVRRAQRQNEGLQPWGAAQLWEPALPGVKDQNLCFPPSQAGPSEPLAQLWSRLSSLDCPGAGNQGKDVGVGP